MLARRDEVDLVVVTVRVARHCEPVLAALKAGKPVLCEWPLAMDLAKAEELAAFASDRGGGTAVGLQGRSAPVVPYLRDLLGDGYVGDVLSTTLVASVARRGRARARRAAVAVPHARAARAVAQWLQRRARPMHWPSLSASHVFRVMPGQPWSVSLRGSVHCEPQAKGDAVITDQFEDMGPIDYMVMEWGGDQPATGEVMPLLMDLVDRGLVRILDLAFLSKNADGEVSTLDLTELAQEDAGLADFEGAASGLIGQDDLDDAATALEPNTVAAVLVWENLWAAPVAVALRRTGGQLVASGRIPVQALLASLDASEAIHG